MNRVITSPPNSRPQADSSVVGGWWHDDLDGRIVCDLCPRECRLKPGDRGFCFVRENQEGQMRLTTYGRSTGFCIDPIEKKPLNHFFPGTSVLSFGTAGCNLGCKFCQNWSISKSREIRQLSETASPAVIAQAAVDLNCRSVAFTYNDPVIWAEYAIDTAKECRSLGVKTVAVTAGYITPLARPEFFQWMDAANVDLKAFTEHFYQHLTLSHLEPVLDTLIWLQRESDVWFEITNLVVPGENDGDDEFHRMCDWIVSHLGSDVPVHFTAFHPDFRLQDHPRTPVETLLRAQEIAGRAGIRYAYVGNVDDVRHQSTYCPSCKGLLIERNWYELGRYHIEDHRCGHCREPIAGHFDASPGSWGRRRLPVNIGRYARATSTAAVGAPDRRGVPSPSQENCMTSSEPPAIVALTAAPAAASDRRRPELNRAQQAAALRAASELVHAAVNRHEYRWSDETLAGAAELSVLGCFVSIKRKGRLRGCCGFLGRQELFRRALQESATTSAIGDMRMPKIARDELPYLDFEIWLLHGLERIEARGEDRLHVIEIGRHGLQIQLGQSRGLLLPGVATDHGFDAAAFLRQVSLKAGLPPTAWKDDEAQLYTFEGCVVRGPFDRSVLPEPIPAARRYADDDITRLVEFCRKNIVAIARGAVPDYYLSEVSDGAVHGVCLTVGIAERREGLQFSRVALRNTLPLQSTLFQLCESAGLGLSDLQSVPPDALAVELAILDEPAMQGTVAEPDLDGFDPARRAIFVVQGNKSAWRYDPSQAAEELFSEVVKSAEISLPDQAAAYSFVAMTSGQPIHALQVPRPRRGGAVRPSAVAGSFYPSDPQQLSRLLEQLAPCSPVTAEVWRAVLVPHAGLVYSGRIAADVLRRVVMPRSIIVIGPKHTNLGVDWAVAPHETWSLPGVVVASDPDLAERLCRSIDGLQMDAAAHQREHAIEVELPWLARWAPASRVVGIAIGTADFQLCQDFAAGLSQAIAAEVDETLLVISTDMNHFATDSETRRVDAMAIEAMEQLDAERLYHTVRDHHISMCGMLPACIVLETLRQMNRLSEARTVAYGTSGDISGDRSRVVGYAGMLFR